MIKPRAIAAVFVLASLASLLSACTGTLSQPIRDQYTGDFAEYYNQPVQFSSCGDKLRCAEISAPMDWSDPASESISLALAYRVSDLGEGQPFLLFNPGGPGSSGVDWITQSSEYLGTARLRREFNILGFDPRGVGSSSAVECLSDAEYEDFLYGVSGAELGSEADIAATRSAIAEFTASCQSNTGELLGFVDTVSAARDMDLIRALIGAEQLNYLGYSYGSFLGTTYATLFPERVGRFVLDGAIDPTVEGKDQTLAQVVAFENSLRAFLTGCREFSDCPFTGDLQKDLAEVKKLLSEIEDSPLPTSTSRNATIWMTVTGLIMPLYSKDYWPALSTAFAQALRGNGDGFMRLADFYNDRAEDGSYSTNLIAANYAISCLDARDDSSAEAMARENARLIEQAPILGRYWQFGALRCEQWPYPIAKAPSDYRASGAATILVIGTTGDPATPYSQAVSLAGQVLDNAFLLSYRGEGHTVYGQQVSCVNDVVDEFFRTGQLPQKDPMC